MKLAYRVTLFTMIGLFMSSCDGCICDDGDRRRWRRDEGHVLRIIEASPRETTDNRRPLIRAIFNHEMDDTTMVAGTFRVRDDTGDLDGTVRPVYSTDDLCNGVSFLPDDPLEPDTCYTVTVTTHILDMEGESLRDDYEWTFCVQAAPLLTWQEPEAFEPDDPGASQVLPSLTLEPLFGVAVVTWLRRTVNPDLSHRHDLETLEIYLGGGSTWESIQRRQDDLGAGQPPCVASSSGGQYWLIASMYDTGADRYVLRTQYAHYEDRVYGIEWGHPGQSAEGVAPLGHPSLAADVAGDVLVVFEMIAPGETRPGIYAGRTVSPQTWVTPILLQRLPGADVKRPRLAMNGSGLAFAVWEVEDDPAIYALRGARYEKDGAGDGWTWIGSLDDTPFAGVAKDPAVAVDETDHAFIVWAREDAATSTVHAIRFPPGHSAPSAPVDLSAGLAGRAERPSIAAVPLDRAVAVWTQTVGPLEASLMAMVYVVGAGWRDRATVWTGPRCREPFVAAGSHGEVIVVWTDDASVFASHYLGADVWSTPEVLSRPGMSVDFVERPSVGIDDAGRALAVWQQMDYRWTIRIARYE
jgi:hypothetical protein